MQKPPELVRSFSLAVSFGSPKAQEEHGMTTTGASRDGPREALIESLSVYNAKEQYKHTYTYIYIDIYIYNFQIPILPLHEP